MQRHKCSMCKGKLVHSNFIKNIKAIRCYKLNRWIVVKRGEGGAVVITLQCCSDARAMERQAGWK